MTSNNTRRIRRRLPAPVLVAVAVVTALTAPAAASASPGLGPGPGPAQATALTQAFEAGLHIPGSLIGGIRPGTLHTGAAAGTDWAIASFTPSVSAGNQVAAGFQDGAGTGVFSNQNGRWRLLETGPYGCGEGLPGTLRKAWGLADPAGCAGPIATQRAAARHALSAVRDDAIAGLDRKIASIALSQVGISDTPAVTSFATDCDPYSTLTAGFSANADGCGHDTTFDVENENETWCSDFNKWVWERPASPPT